MKKQDKDVASDIVILKMTQGVLRLNILGATPLIYERMSEKARFQLLMPAGKKNAAEKASSLKHRPLEEYQGSMYRFGGEAHGHKTRLFFPTSAFKKAAASAALDMPGAAKSQVGRLMWTEGLDTELYGVPQMFMSVVRSSDMNRTPDIRTRAILPQWACALTVRFTSPLTETSVANLLAAAGVIRGIGGWRQEKGSGSYGQFSLVSGDDDGFVRVVKTGGAKAQDEAIAEPEFYDQETEELYRLYTEMAAARGSLGLPKNGKSGATAEEAEDTLS